MKNGKEHHQMIVGRFIKNKLQEFEYFLFKIVEICGDAEEKFRTGSSSRRDENEDINYYFNAFSSVYQTLKDSLETATGKKLSWSSFSNVRHSNFFKECRNAITHDGMQVINALIDGKYYVASDIERFDKRGTFIRLEAPASDVRTLCVEFALDLSNKIDEIVDLLGDDIPQSSGKEHIGDLEKILISKRIPEFARKILMDNKNVIDEKLSSHKFNAAEDIKKQTSSIRTICDGT